MTQFSAQPGADRTLSALMDEVDVRTGELIALLQALVRIESVSTPDPDSGHETECCRLLSGWLAERGIESHIIESRPGRGNLFAALGGGPMHKPKLLWLSHSDVVGAGDPAEWTAPPFEAIVRDGRVWGRGTLDCKGLIACQALALGVLHGAGFAPRQGLRLAVTADEESGCNWGARWLAENLAKEIDAECVLNEGPGLPVLNEAGCGYLFPVGAKGLVQVEITVHGRSFHASQPWRADNPLFGLAEILRRIAAYQPERDISSPVFGYLDRLAGVIVPVTTENVDGVIEGVARQNHALAHRLFGLSRLSLAPTIVRGGQDRGIVPSVVQLTVQACILPGQRLADVRRLVEGLLAGVPGAEARYRLHAEPSASDPGTAFAEEIRQAMIAAYGRSDIYLAPIIMNGAGDTRYLRPLGAVAYDFWPLHPDGAMEGYRSHCADESIEIETLVSSTRMLVALAWQMLGEDHEAH